MKKSNVYVLYPYLRPVKNKYELLFSILFGRSPNKIKLKNNSVIETKTLQFDTILCILGAICYSTSYLVKSNIIELCFDMKNKFIINLNTLTLEDENLLKLLFYAQRHGANFLLNTNISITDFRDKTFNIFELNDKKIIQTSTGIKFYLDSIQPQNTIMETFVQKIHQLNSKDNWNDKIIVDVGAECGDTPLYFASLGATVYAFEPVKDHYDAMIRNLTLNPELAKKIIPINAAIGYDGILKFNQSSLAKISGVASFVYNVHGKNSKTFEIQGYSIKSAFEKFNIDHIDLLKMDCKGCEFFLDKEDLKNVDKVKIEYLAGENTQKITELYKMLEDSGFKNMIYRGNPFANYSNKLVGRIYGKK